MTVRHQTYWRLALLLLLTTFTEPARAHGPLHEQIAALSASIDANPTNAALYYRRGELRVFHEENEAAVKDFERALVLEPALDKANLGIARALIQDKKPQPALVALNTFLSKHPGYSEALLYRARARTEVGDVPGAMADFDASLQSASSPEPDFYLERAAFLAKNGLTDRAISGLDEGIKRLGPVPGLQLKAVEIELGRGSHEAALKRIDQMLAKADRKEFLLCRRAAILESSGNKAGAKAAYAKAWDELQALPVNHSMTPALKKLSAEIQLAMNRLTNP
jgi:tetratricopeptide (TPR) repeat protein